MATTESFNVDQENWQESPNVPPPYNSKQRRGRDKACLVHARPPARVRKPSTNHRTFHHTTIPNNAVVGTRHALSNPGSRLVPTTTTNQRTPKRTATPSLNQNINPRNPNRIYPPSTVADCLQCILLFTDILRDRG